MPSRASLRTLLLGLVTLSVQAGCRRGSEPEVVLWTGKEHPPIERQFHAERWDTLWAVGGSVQDTTLLNPYRIQAGPTGIYVFDIAPQRILALDAEGKRRWSFGRKGAGPDEFRNVRDMKLTGTGELFILDPQNNRIAVLDPAGRVSRRIPLTKAGHAEQMAPLGGERVALVTMQQDRPLKVIDHAGAVVEEPSFAWPGFTSLHPIARQGLMAVDADGARWVFGFMLGDGWFPFRGTRPAGYVGRYVDHRPFPPIEEENGKSSRSVGLAQYTPCTGCDVQIADSSVYFLSGGSDRTERAVVDRFSWSDGRYLSSYRLPGRSEKVAIHDGTFYVVVSEPYPAVLALRPIPVGGFPSAGASP